MHEFDGPELFERIRSKKYQQPHAEPERDGDRIRVQEKRKVRIHREREEDMHEAMLEARMYILDEEAAQTALAETETTPPVEATERRKADPPRIVIPDSERPFPGKPRVFPTRRAA